MGKADKTRARILDAARQILARDGFASLGVNALAAEAGVAKPLVYRYFGDMQGVVSALVEGTGTEGTQAPSAMAPAAGLGSQTAEEAVGALVRYGRGLAADRTLRDLLAWSLASDTGPPLDEMQGDAAPQAADPAAGPPPHTDRAAIMTLLQAAITFLLLCRDRHSQWAGMPLTAPRHMARLERALAAIIQATYQEPKVTK